MPELQHPCSVLVVDDDAAIREALAAMLEDEGYAVALAGNGREALDYLHAHPHPCLILLDLMMPVMNGQEFRAAQRAEAELSSIPVAVISAHGPRDVQHLLDAEDVLPKPIHIDRLLQTVARHCLA